MCCNNNIPVEIRESSKFKALGFVASNKRKISSGKEFDKYFGKPNGTTTMVSNDATVYDTLSLMENIILRTVNQTKAITKYLESISNSDEQFYKNLFDFIYKHVQYQQDTAGVEQLRQPARMWADRLGDCDCYSIFISSVLHNYKGGVKHSLRIIKMKGTSHFHHVYVVVPKHNNKSSMKMDRNDYYVIDPVLDNFNQEAEFIIEKFDKSLSGKVGLSGGLGSITPIPRYRTDTGNGVSTSGGKEGVGTPPRPTSGGSRPVDLYNPPKDEYKPEGNLPQNKSEDKPVNTTTNSSSLMIVIVLVVAAIVFGVIYKSN